MKCRYCGGKIVHVNGAVPRCEDCHKTYAEQVASAERAERAIEVVFGDAVDAAADIFLDLGDE